MKKTLFSLGVCMTAGALLVSCQSGNGGNSNFSGDLDDESGRFSYALGMEIGQSLKEFGSEVEAAAFVAGMNATLSDQEPRLSPQEAEEVKRTVFMRLQSERQAKMKADGEANQKAEDQFFAANKGKEGVVETPSGLQYQVLRQGTGDRPGSVDRVRVHYKGSLLDGTEFDNSYTRGEPAVLGVNQVIPGWSEGLQLMQVGGKYKLWVPAKLGYGARAMGDKIKPNSTLVFELELLAIEK